MVRPTALSRALAPLTALALAVIAILLWIAKTNGGKMVYTLDDPYIHLSLARRIAQGHYGINLGENSAPSSSILWPFLLAPFAPSLFAEYVPLALCLFSSLATVLAALWCFPQHNRWLVAAVVITLTNQVGLIFTGMEHNLQVLLALVAALGLVKEGESGEATPWLILALATGPLVRYENLAITLPAVVYLWIRGHRRKAAIAIALPVLVMIGFSLYLKSMGLGLLPSSVVAKSGAGMAGNPILDLLNNFKRNMTSRETLLECYSYLILLAVLIAAAIRAPGISRALAMTGVGAGVIHLFLGRFGWAGRYEPYIVAFDGALLVSVWKDIPFVKRTPFATTDYGGLAARVLGVAMVPLAGYYVLLRGLRAPTESHDIFLQQYQMHRFVTQHWHQPVAVNDLGWVSWRNDAYVLDLWGLGSYEALKLRASEKGDAWMATLCQRHGVKVALVYDDWFNGTPPEWRRVATLSRFQGKARPRDDVAIYATAPEAVSELRSALERFAQTLPDGATLKLAEGH